MPNVRNTRPRRNTRYPRKVGANKKYQANKRKNLANYRRAKNRFQASRRPFVEVKSQSHSDLWARLGGTPDTPTSGDVITDPRKLVNMSVVPAGSPPGTPSSALITQFFHMWSFLSPLQGLGSQSMIGKTVTAKYLTCKVHFEFPIKAQLTNPRYYLIHGFVTIPMNGTLYTDPTRGDTTRSDIITHIQNHLKRDFDETRKEEFLRFNEKRQKDYKILGYKRIAPNRNRQQLPGQIVYNSDAGNNVVHGVNSDKDYILKFPMNNKKITYSAGKQLTTPPPGLNMYYPNKSWLPFVLYYCPDAGHVVGGHDNSPSIAFNDKFWFTDS